VQMPSDPVWLHDPQGSLHARLQHTPSTSALAPTQKPETQSSLLWQTALLGLLPHLPATHCCPAAHCELVVQVKVQWLVSGLQVYGGQIREGAGSDQLPLPSQETMPVTLSPSQVPSLHSVPLGYLRQPPLPSQVPSC